MNYKFFKLLLLSLAIGLVFVSVARADMADRLSGRVLLQVESRGEAWYVYPVNQKRYFLGRGHDAAKVIRALGMGVSNKTFNSWKGKAPKKLSGRILLKVEDSGKAYYVYPINLKLIYLGSPEEAFNVLRKYGLGVSNKHLAQITPEFNLTNPANSPAPTAPAKPTTPTTPVVVAPTDLSKAGRTTFNWNYKGKSYNLSLALDKNLYEAYKQSSKVYKYYGELPDNWHDDYYKMFLTPKGPDTTIKELANQLRFIANKESMSEDEMVNLTMAFVQTIPYDNSKDLDTGRANYPYETLFIKLGVCSDKTFLAVMILRELGFGAAVIDFPDVNHAAVGIQCPDKYAVYGSGYCYAETTNFFPIGIIPQSLGAKGVVANLGSEAFKGQFSNVFKIDQLGKPEILQKTKGKEYRGVEATYITVQKLLQLEKDLAAALPELNQAKADMMSRLADVNSLKALMTEAQAKGDIAKYNSYVSDYNVKVVAYNNNYGNYKLKSDLYNSKVRLYNDTVANFYPSK